MNIRGVFLDCFGEQRVDQANDRRFVCTLQQVFWLGQMLCHVGQIQVFMQIIDHLLSMTGFLFVSSLEQNIKNGFAGLFEFNRFSNKPANLK